MIEERDCWKDPEAWREQERSEGVEVAYWFIADIENDYGGTYAQFIRAEDLPKVWSKVRGLENTNYPPGEERVEVIEEKDAWKDPDAWREQERVKRRDDRFRHKVATVLQGIQDLLVAKNEAYGNSALDPVNIFSKSTAVEQIKVRIDDKLSRLYHGKEYGDEDTITDLMGYLILLRIAEREAEDNE